MEGKKSEKAKVCWTRRCPKALFPRISIIIARLAIQVRVCRTYTYTYDFVKSSDFTKSRSSHPEDGYVRSFSAVLELPGGKEGYDTEFAG
ncbi:unnamed protein product [Lasius platythorax]|uniref:Uncharacterized protein n=1 Tax=Lasius platythorax TaxID=488582 RepID=A0AAV2NAZ8_9HYME